jgi:hypothetical protein
MSNAVLPSSFIQDVLAGFAARLSPIFCPDGGYPNGHCLPARHSIYGDY